MAIRGWKVWSVLAVAAMAAVAIIAIKRYVDSVDMPWSLIAPSQQVAAVTNIDKLRNEGRFDDAIELGLHSLNGHAGDDFMYQTIATTYFIRSLHDKEQSGKWAKLGGVYSEKALASNPNDIANVFNVGVNYMIVGDDLDSGGCEYYRKALDIFEALVPRLQGGTAVTQGRTVRLAPFRKQNDEYLAMLRSSLRHC